MTALYRVLLLCFPRRVRREFGDDMARMFEAQVRRARSSGESLTRLWVFAFADAVVHGLAERRGLWGTRLQALARAPRHGRRWMWAWRHDVRQTLRMVARQPGMTGLAVLTLALGIGANVAIFSAVDTVLLRPLPYDEPDRLVMVWESRIAEGVYDNTVAPADYADWEQMNTVFESMAAQSPVAVSSDLTGGGEPLRLAAGVVTTRFFDVFRVRPFLGRTFREEDGVAGQHRVVVLGHPLWRRQFGGDPAIVGRSIQLNGLAHQVIGVLPETFEFPDPTFELWAPRPLRGLSAPLNRSSHELNVYARLKPGVSLEQARTEMARLGGQLAEQHAFTNRGHGAWVISLRDELIEPVRPALWLLFGAVGFVLLIACVNVANLLLVRAVGRRREMAIRSALGAGRARLAGQLLTESLVLGLLGGAAGVLVAYWAIRAIRLLVPPDVAVVGLAHLGLDLRVLGFALLVSLLTSVLFGLLPAWQTAREELTSALQAGGPRNVGGVRRRLRMALVVSEIAVASLLLVGAGLALRSFTALLNVPAGFTTEGRLTLPVSLPNSRYGRDETVLRAFDQVERRLAAIPGVRRVGGTGHVPLSGQDQRRGIAIEGGSPQPDAPTRAHPRGVTPGYMQAMGLQLVDGRGFTDADRADTPRVIIVNETMAKRYWPGVSPIGRRVAFAFIDNPQWREVVGVVRDVRHWGLAAAVNPEMYMPLPQYPMSTITFVLATDRAPAEIADSLRETLRAVDPNLPLAAIRTMDDVATRSIALQRGVMVLLAAFGVTALVLAAAGIYGVMAHFVSLRTGEIGVRLALGARRSSVLRGILAEGLAHAAWGLAIGLAGGVALVRVFRRLLFGVQPGDPLTLVAVAAVMLAAALVACLVPALRAMRVDPVVALRQ